MRKLRLVLLTTLLCAFVCGCKPLQANTPELDPKLAAYAQALEGAQWAGWVEDAQYIEEWAQDMEGYTQLYRRYLVYGGTNALLGVEERPETRYFYVSVPYAEVAQDGDMHWYTQVVDLDALGAPWGLRYRNELSGNTLLSARSGWASRGRVLFMTRMEGRMDYTLHAPLSVMEVLQGERLPDEPYHERVCVPQMGTLAGQLETITMEQLKELFEGEVFRGRLLTFIEFMPIESDNPYTTLEQWGANHANLLVGRFVQSHGAADVRNERFGRYTFVAEQVLQGDVGVQPGNELDVYINYAYIDKDFRYPEESMDGAYYRVTPFYAEPLLEQRVVLAVRTFEAVPGSFVAEARYGACMLVWDEREGLVAVRQWAVRDMTISLPHLYLVERPAAGYAQTIAELRALLGVDAA